MAAPLGPGRRLLSGVVAIAALAGGSVLAISLATREAGPPPRRVAAPAEAAAPAPPPAPPEIGIAAAPASTAPPAGLLGQGVPVEVVREAPPAPPPAGSWEAVPLSPRPAGLGPMGAALGRELNDLQPALSACFDEEVQARHGAAPVTRTAEAAPDDVGVTVLVLELEAGGGTVRVVDAPVESRGGASDGLIACAQRVLRGKVFEAPVGPRQGGRHRVLFPLSP